MGIFINSFINGIPGTGIKNESVQKHLKSDIHQASVSKYENAVKSLNEFGKSSPIGQSMVDSCMATNHRVQKLVDISYVTAKEEISFMKFQKLVELELCHGVMVLIWVKAIITKVHELNLRSVIQMF